MKRTLTLLIIFLFIFTHQASAESYNIKDEMIYDILIDRFNNGETRLEDEVDVEDPYTYNGGDIKGITKKLDHIRTFGFTTISLSSVMENAKSGYHGYWIEDFYEVDDHLGTMEELQELVNEAHDKDVKVILEFAPNYVAKSHPFTQDSEKEDWFIEQDVEAEDSLFWLEDVKRLDLDNEDVQDYLIEVAHYWKDELDIDGFNLHAADQSASSFLERFTNEFSSDDFYLIASTLSDDGKVEVTEQMTFDAVVDNDLLEQMQKTFSEPDQPIKEVYEKWQDAEYTPLMTVDNKNGKRFSHMMRENGRDTTTGWRMTLAFLYTADGVPFIYQGSELPMFGPTFEESQWLMQFNSTDPDLEEVYSRISSIKSEFSVLADGDFEEVGSHDAFSLFKRVAGDDEMYIAINNSSESKSIAVTDIDPSLQLRGLLEDNTVRENKDGEFIVGIPRESAEIYMVEENKGFNWLLIGFVVGVFVLFVAFIIALSRKQKERERKATEK